MKNKKLKRIKAWVKALKSGKYKQTTEQLYDGKGFCCLGVATDLYLKEKGKEWQKETSRCYGVDNEFNEFETSELTTKIASWYGLKLKSPEVSHKGMSRTLMYLNDSEKLSFKKIAKLIKKTYLN
jgi:hypothetical protein